MKSVAGRGRKGKKARVLGEPAVVSAEEFATMEFDAQVELIQALIPLGLMAVSQNLEAEVIALAGERYRREGGQPGLVRHGTNPGSVRLGGQRVPIRVPRVRNLAKGTEVSLATLQALRGAPGSVDETLLRRVLYGLSCHNYEAAAEAFPGAIGLSPSTVTRQFIQASAAKLRELQERDLSVYDVVAIGLDGGLLIRSMRGALAAVGRDRQIVPTLSVDDGSVGAEPTPGQPQADSAEAGRDESAGPAAPTAGTAIAPGVTFRRQWASPNGVPSDAVSGSQVRSPAGCTRRTSQ